ncbi:MAG: glycosyl hydrolase 108 family protein [Smithellaceae bacterium]|nr:glycosyl hydrolase 108 family protein [Smithellaceae bacterium]
MADFGTAFEKTLKNEGGYRLVNVKEDRGGQTYAGIARNCHPDWSGWRYIDQGDSKNPALSSLVQDFYRRNFWLAISGDKIKNQIIAEAIFDFSVNAGTGTAIKAAQTAMGVNPDGRIGPITLGALDTIDGAQFIAKYALAKIARYAEICRKDKTQTKFLLGWINRTLDGVV